MDLSEKIRPVLLKATSIEGLKTEIGQELARLAIRHPKAITLQSFKVPMGISGLLPASESIEQTLVLPVAGTASDFISFLPEDAEDILLRFTVYSKGASNRSELILKGGVTSYSLDIDTPSLSYVKLTLVNQGKKSVDCIAGFTFQERRAV